MFEIWNLIFIHEILQQMDGLSSYACFCSSLETPPLSWGTEYLHLPLWCEGNLPWHHCSIIMTSAIIFSTWEHVVELCRLSFVVFETGLLYRDVQCIRFIGLWFPQRTLFHDFRFSKDTIVDINTLCFPYWNFLKWTKSARGSLKTPFL